MTKKLPLTDFRAVRWVLEPSDFALSNGEDGPPTKLVDQATWHGIMDAPDDVAIRTSDHQGNYLKLLSRLESDWIDAVGATDHDELSGCMLCALECLQCMTFDFLHGYYRSALSNLRSALELTLIGAYGNVNPLSKKYIRWKDDASILYFTGIRKEIGQTAKGRPYNRLLGDGQILATPYNDLCRFTHCRPDATDGDIWEGNGPVYCTKGVRLTLEACCHVYMACYLLIKITRPRFKLPCQTRVLLKIDWLRHHAELSQAFLEIYDLSE